MARAGAVSLARFYDGIQGARDAGPAHLTAIGHSYGSLTTGLALQQPGDHGVSDAIFYGSPGEEASTPAQLNLASGHALRDGDPDDPIQWVYDAPPLVKAVAAATPPPFDDVLLALSDLSGTGILGPTRRPTRPSCGWRPGRPSTPAPTAPHCTSRGRPGTATRAGLGGPGNGRPARCAPWLQHRRRGGRPSDRAIKGD